MPGRIVELAFDTRGLSADRDGRIRTSRKFYVQGVLPAQIPTNTVFTDDLGNALPKNGDAHPDGHGIVDATDRAPLGGHSTIYTAFYSTDGSFKYLASPRPEDPAYPVTLPQFDEVVIDIPVQIKRTRTVADGAGTVTYWDIDPITFTESREAFTLETYVSSVSWAETDYMRGQINKLHQFRGRYWRFRTPTFSRSGSGFQITYRWEDDLGTPAFTGGLDLFTPGDPAAMFSPGPPPVGFCRSPFAVLKVIPLTALPGLTGYWQQVFPYVHDDNGYLALPGIGALL